MKGFGNDKNNIKKQIAKENEIPNKNDDKKFTIEVF